MVAREGMIGQIFVNAGRMGHQAAPFGGIDGRLSTNPIAFAAPRREAEPLLVDMTTSVVAEGKIRVALNKGDHVPEGWIIDAQGNPTTDPQDFKGDPPGAMLPMGGVVAHKGYALSLMVEILGGALSGLGCASGAPTMTSNGVFLQVYDIEHFVDMEDYYRDVESLVGPRQVQPDGTGVQRNHAAGGAGIPQRRAPGARRHRGGRHHLVAHLQGSRGGQRGREPVGGPADRLDLAAGSSPRLSATAVSCPRYDPPDQSGSGAATARCASGCGYQWSS